MANEKQIQKAGDNSTQIQADAVYLVGIDEKRAREVYTEMSKLTIEQCTSEAEATANARIGRFEEALIPRIERIEKDFKSFSDPSFQVLLRKAQLTAACTDREGDYTVLAELLTHRVKNKDNIKKKASIQRAVEIVDQIDEDALCGLTVLFALLTYTPITGDIEKGINVLDHLYNRLLYYPLPQGTDWIDNLTILGAITVNSSSQFNKYENILCEALSGYTSIGVHAESESGNIVKDILDEQNLGYMLVDHKLLEGYKRICLPQTTITDRTQAHHYVNVNGKVVFVHCPFDSNQQNCLRRAIANYTKDVNLSNQVKQRFVEEIHRRESIACSASWFNSISNAISITSVGKVIAHTNAKRIDPTLPDLDK